MTSFLNALGIGMMHDVAIRMCGLHAIPTDSTIQAIDFALDLYLRDVQVSNGPRTYAYV